MDSIIARAIAAIAAVERAVADGTATSAMLRPIIAGALDIERAGAWLRGEAADRMHKLTGAALADSPETQRDAREAIEPFRAARTESETAAAVRGLCATMESGDTAEPAAEADRP